MKENDYNFHLFKGNEDLYHKFKENLVGGSSIIFHHYHEKNKTKIRGNKICKQIIGYDANTLYLETIGREILCGEHYQIEPYNGIVEDVLSSKFYGIIECDIEVPGHLKE